MATNSQTPKRPRPTKTKNKNKSTPKTNLVDWLTNHWTLVVVVGLIVLVLIVVIAASLGDNKDSNDVAEPEPRPDSSGPIAVGDLELNIHQWDCGRMAFEHLSEPQKTITAGEGNHFCVLGIKVTNQNTEKNRAFDPASPRIRFNGQDYIYSPTATKNGLGGTAGVRILPAGVGLSDDSVAPLVNMVFEISQDPADGSLIWREDAQLLIPTSSNDDDTLLIDLLDYDKQ